MRTGVSVSKTRNRISTIATVTGSVAIIALAIAFVSVDYNDFYLSSAFTVDSSMVEALEPIRSDPASEPSDSGNGSNGDGDGSGDNRDNPNGMGNLSDDNTDDDNNNPNDNYTDHGLPCLDPNCPIHHGGGENDNSQTHQTPCRDPDCPICYPDGNSNNDAPPADISMEIIRFKSNSSEYADETAAQAALNGYIDSIDRYFEIYPDGKIYLVGCIAKTANWSLTETELSQQRADAVKQSLIDLGVDENKLVSIGVGINDPWRSDEWANGYFDEEIAKTNRRVWLVPDQYEEQVGLVIAIDEMLDGMKSAE